MFLAALIMITALAVGLLGNMRRIGFWGAFFASLLLTPFGGFVLALLSGPKERPPQPLPQNDEGRARPAQVVLPP